MCVNVSIMKCNRKDNSIRIKPRVYLFTEIGSFFLDKKVTYQDMQRQN